MRLDSIVIRSYDQQWPASFAEASELLGPRLSPWLSAPIQHIGSTAVPGMPAKPIIDMLALTPDYESFAGALADASDLGWIHAPEPGDREHRTWSLCFPSVEHRTHHLHVVEDASDDWRDWLLFRDYLRTHPRAVGRYADVKRHLAETDSTDRVAYRAGKAPLIKTLMEEARAWRDR